jgi:hypothetical protein
MNISSFEDLLHAARQQPEPQRLLFVFADVELPDDSTAEQRARFQAGEGGTFVPLMSVSHASSDATGLSCSWSACPAATDAHRRVTKPTSLCSA